MIKKQILMKENWHISDNINEMLGDHLDVDQAWNNFNNRKKKKGAFFWYKAGFVLLTIFVISISAIVFYIGNDTVFKKDTQLLSDKKVESSQSKKTKSTDVEKRDLRSLKTVEEEEVSNIILPEKKNEKGPSIKTNLSDKLEKEIIKIDRVIQKKSSFVIENNKDATVESNTNISPEFDLKNTNSKDANIPLNYVDELNIKPVESTTNKQGLPKVDDLDNVLAFKQINELEILDLDQALYSKKENLPMAFIPNHKSSWSLGFVYGYNKVNRDLSGDDDLYLNRRVEGEKFLEAQYAALKIKRTLNKYLFVSTGLGFNQYRSKINDQIQLVETRELHGQVVEIRKKDGIIQQINGTLISTTTTLVENIRYQSYRSIYIPLEIGLQYPFGKKWKVEISSGINYNILQKTKGNIYQSSYSIGEYEPLSSGNYKSHSLVEGVINAKLARKIYNNLEIQIGINARADLNNRMGNNDSNTMDKFQSIGAEIGIFKQF